MPKYIDADALKEKVKYSMLIKMGYLNDCTEMGHEIDAEYKKQILANIDFHKAFIELIDKQPTIEALEEPQWTLCSEKLPEENGRYLVTRGLKACNSIWNIVYIINYSDLMGLKAGKIWWDGNVGKSDFQRIDDVVAWRYLPKPWRGDAE